MCCAKAAKKGGIQPRDENMKRILNFVFNSYRKRLYLFIDFKMRY